MTHEICICCKREFSTICKISKKYQTKAIPLSKITTVHNYICIAANFIGGGNQSTLIMRKPRLPACH